MKKLFWGLIGAIILVGGYWGYNYYLETQINEINATISETTTAAGETPFTAYDATQFTGTHEWLGKPVKIVYESQLLGSSNNYGIAPNEQNVKKVLAGLRGTERVILDAGSWVIFKDNKIDPNAANHAQWYLTVVQWARELVPGTDIGFLSLPFSPWSALADPTQSSAEYDKAVAVVWKVMQLSDSLYPMLDIPDNDIERMKAVAAAYHSIAINVNKPYYPVLWHKGSGGKFKGILLPDALIKWSCNVVRNNASGVVWWSGAGETWDGGVWYPAAAECFS